MYTCNGFGGIALMKLLIVWKVKFSRLHVETETSALQMRSSGRCATSLGMKTHRHLVAASSIALLDTLSASRGITMLLERRTADQSDCAPNAVLTKLSRCRFRGAAIRRALVTSIEPANAILGATKVL